MSSSRTISEIMRDRQARNKDPKTGRALRGEEENPREKFSISDDGYEAAERRRWAASILDSPELLMMHAQARGDSVPGTRQYFTKILCGYETEKRKDAKPVRRREEKRVESR